MSDFFCMNCDAPIGPGEPPASGDGRTVTRFVQCGCGTTTRFGSADGWGRWYALDYFPSHSPADSTELFGYRAYIDRLETTTRPEPAGGGE